MPEQEPEYMCLAKLLLDGKVDDDFAEFLDGADALIKKMKPYGGLQSSQVILVLYILWQSLPD
jgi:hypothetical protein